MTPDPWHTRWTRLLRHLWQDERASQRAVPPDMAQRLASRVAASEQRHSGEVRMCVDAALPLGLLWRHVWHAEPWAALMREHAITSFSQLRVWDTPHNNGVLIHLLLSERHIELVADRGLKVVDAAEWQAVVQRLSAALGGERIEDGLTEALAEVSALLVRTHASQADEPNALPNAPVLR